MTARHAQLGVGHHGVTAMHEAVGQRHEDVVTGAQLVEQGDGLRPDDVPAVEVLPLLAGERHVGEGDDLVDEQMLDGAVEGFQVELGPVLAHRLPVVDMGGRVRRGRGGR